LGNNKATEVSSAIVAGGRFYNHNIFKLYVQPFIYYVSKNFCVSVGGKQNDNNVGFGLSFRFEKMSEKK
jgi:hypothetical protein